MGADATAGLAKRVASAGFAFVPGSRTRQLIEQHAVLHDWEAFTESWNSLPLDDHMADHGRYRRRRHAMYSVDAKGKITRLPHQPHFQSLDYNPLNGGVERMYEPVDERLGKGPSVRGILGWCASLFGALVPDSAWRVEMHQFRIEAGVFGAGKPTPEGMHRDGVDYVLVLLIQRRNIDSGTTMIGSGPSLSESMPVMVDTGSTLGETDMDPFDTGPSVPDRDAPAIDPDASLIFSQDGAFDATFSESESQDDDFHTSFRAGDGNESFVDSFTLTDAFDAALVDDHRVFHGVTPVQAHDPSKPAFRDVLVVTFSLA